MTQIVSVQAEGTCTPGPAHPPRSRDLEGACRGPRLSPHCLNSSQDVWGRGGGLGVGQLGPDCSPSSGCVPQGQAWTVSVQDRACMDWAGGRLHSVIPVGCGRPGLESRVPPPGQRASAETSTESGAGVMERGSAASLAGFCWCPGQAGLMATLPASFWQPGAITGGGLTPLAPSCSVLSHGGPEPWMSPSALCPIDPAPGRDPGSRGTEAAAGEGGCSAQPDAVCLSVQGPSWPILL